VFGYSTATRWERSTPTRIGNRVRFHRADIFLPDTSEVGTARSGGEDLEGTIVALSDSGEVAHAFAIVEIKMVQSAVVRVEKLTTIATNSEEPLPEEE